ncbi:hypothetical protein [Paraburkholderia sp.]|nr:hypothetical protein [Paraburkholderia sp.]MDE1184018.1 hypothetical protein [Paraburkholderia sp.]
MQLLSARRLFDDLPTRVSSIATRVRCEAMYAFVERFGINATFTSKHVS